MDKASRALAYIPKASTGFNPESFCLLYYSFIKPSPNYTSVSWRPSLDYEIYKIEKNQDKRYLYMNMIIQVLQNS